MSQDRPPVYYSEYLQLDKILHAQLPESEKEGIKADDEMLFIIIHQTYELWFKQVLFEVNLVRNIFKQPRVEDNSADLYNSIHKLKRVAEILKILVDQIGILETMTALDFLDFRDLLRPASGFQSIQFKTLEASLGLQYQDRFGKEYYISQLNQADVEKVKEAEADESLLSLINKWLERMPYIKDIQYWKDTPATDNLLPFWSQYRAIYAQGLMPQESANLAIFDQLFIDAAAYPADRKFSAEASGNALFIMLYRDYPKLQMPFDILNLLLEIDNLLGQWRQRHIQMVNRTIGKRVGTGGSTGAAYLRNAADSHSIFKELAELTSFLLPRHDIPKLPKLLEQHLSFFQP